MSDESPSLFELHTPLFWKCGVLLLVEPSDACEYDLLAHLLEGTYDKPFIRDDGEIRYLHFDMHTIQSAMRLDDPFALDLPYTRKMMSFLLFNSAPRDILLLGLGGGSLAKYCYRHLPLARIRVVEIDARVIALRDQFKIPPNDDRFRIIQGDGTQYVSHCPGEVDVLIIDAFTRKGVAPSLSSCAFYEQARRSLSRDGVLVMNLAGAAADVQVHVERIREIFAGAVILVALGKGMNYVVFAFNNTSGQPDWNRIGSCARELKSNLGLDFPRYVRRLKSEYRAVATRPRQVSNSPVSQGDRS
jgi:spermidine synthase